MIIDHKLDQNIKNLKVDTPVVPGAKPTPNAPSLPVIQQQPMPPQQTYPQPQPPVYYPPQPQLPPQIIQQQPQPVKPKVAKPIRLKYVYEGTCPQDNSEVMTIETDIRQEHYVLAVCPTCQKQWQSRKVEKLDKEEGDENAIQNKKNQERKVQSNKPSRHESQKNHKSKSKKAGKVAKGNRARVETKQAEKKKKIDKSSK